MQFQLNPALISSHADADLDSSGLGAFDDHLTHPLPAEACSELGTEEAAPLPGFAQPNVRTVAFCTAIAALIVVASAVCGRPDDIPAAQEAVADAQAAAFGYGTASSGSRP